MVMLRPSESPICGGGDVDGDGGGGVLVVVAVVTVVVGTFTFIRYIFSDICLLHHLIAGSEAYS